ncbi:MAG: glycosyltransferase [Bacteroidales bacterium]|nr:glycosyltransferase [Bacteroidales bacterium]
MNTPLVSICCITYNHAQFIRKCLDGFLMQQTDFPIEILIHDDCSTDGTTEIIKEYEARYPKLIFPIYEDVNQYQNGKSAEIDLYNYRRARGKYIAYCEGDDYWTDPQKLQKQVDFMEENSDYSVCFHDCMVSNIWNGICEKKSILSTDDDCDITVDEFLNGKNRIGQPLTMLFRKEVYDLNWWKLHTRYCDTMEIMHLLLVGKGRFMQFNGGQYNMHDGGVSSTQPDIERSWELCDDSKQMLDCTSHPAVKRFYIDAYKWRLDICKKDGMILEYWSTIKDALHNNFVTGFEILRYGLKRMVKDLL